GIEKRGGRVVRIELPAGTSPGEARDRTRRLLASHSDIRGFIHLAPLDLFFDTTFDDRVAAGMPGAFFAVLKKLYAALDIPGGFLATLSADSVVWPYQAPSGRIIPAMAGIAGMLKTAAKEMTETRVKVVDFRGSDLKAGPQSITTRFLEELTGSDTRVEAGLSDRQRFALSLKPQAPEKGESCVRAEDTIVVTGGARGITLAILKRLVAGQPVRLVILGRSDITAIDPLFLPVSADEAFILSELKKKMPGAKPVEIMQAVAGITGLKATIANLEHLRAGGHTVDYHAVDVTDADAVAQVFTRYDRIDGVIHAAGVEQSQFIPKKSQASFDLVFSTKVQGALNLLDALQNMDYRFFIAFSSVTARFGNEGQVDYTGANDMLGKLVQREKLKQPGKIFKVMAWTAWEGAGMATDETVKKVLTERGLKFLPLERGVGHFLTELSDNHTIESVYSGRDHAFDPDGLLAGKAKSDPAPVAPFLDRENGNDKGVVEYSRRLDLARDLFLLDHSREDVPIFLGATGIEAMAEAASTCVGGNRNLVALKNFSIPYGIKILRKRPKEIVVSAASSETDADQVNCKISSWFKNPEGVVVGDETLHYRAEYIFADQPVESVKVSLPEYHPVSYDGDIQALLYHPARLFMDGLFRTVTAIPSFKPDELITRIQNAGTRPFFRGQAFPDFMTDVAVVDAMFQTGGMLEVMSTSMIVLPYRIGEMSFVRPVERGVEYLCITRKTRDLEKTNEYQLELVDPGGNLFIRVENFEMVKVDRLPEKFQILDQILAPALEKAS
ncbi:MAG: SDR family NAD(P)-dependent oxidoreductase, partial [Desulfobacterales bacterium]|nr:SDR family NAD(P)-dependent oxidoreductase [Desulfobacterales bacterium]